MSWHCTNHKLNSFGIILKKKGEKKEKETVHPTFTQPSNLLVDGAVRRGGLLDPSSLNLYEDIPSMEVERPPLLSLDSHLNDKEGAM